MRLFLATLAAVLFSTALWAATPETKAEAAAASWLTLIDKADYARSWKAASPLFQARIDKAEWAKAAAAVRAPLGPLVARKPVSIKLRDSLPGVPDGHYAVIHYRARFAHKASAVEAVTMQEDGGAWKGAGYFIH